MGDELSKLRPDRDLQCYFYEPSAIAAFSSTGPDGFTVSGCWRQQFDWAVVEWNRDNVFEHPALRNLPDGDLSGVRLSYRETRTNCIPIDSRLYPTVDWPYLRVWADVNGKETIYRVPILEHATSLTGSSPATGQFELQGSITAGDYIELSWLDQHFNYAVSATDTLESAAAALATIISANRASGLILATAKGAVISLTYLGMPGSNGNRVGAYGTVQGAGTERWAPEAVTFSGGVTAPTWQIDLDFSDLRDENGVKIPTGSIRKLRWTWAADLQPQAYQRSEFSVVISNWTVSGDNLSYKVAGPGSRRIENVDDCIAYSGTWKEERGNYSGGSIHRSTEEGASISCSYMAGAAHNLYLGTRYLENGAELAIEVDGEPSSVSLALHGEDVLARVPLGLLAAGEHSVSVTHTGAEGSALYFDFLELAIPTDRLPTFAVTPRTTLATDWDTAHSQVIGPERTAWLLDQLGFKGRANHYAGCLWFYELTCSGQRYASATIQFSGAPEFGKTTSLFVGGTRIDHVNLIGDTAESIAKCFELWINAGSTGVWASADGSALTITARAMGSDGNGIQARAVTNSTVFLSEAGSEALEGGVDGRWITDVSALPPLNRAARDWTASFLAALKGYGIEATVSFSMELGNGDDSVAAGIAQRYPDGTAAWLNTPSLQTNFGPESTAFWQQVYLEMAGLMDKAGVPVYLQFGEVQWWYFCPPTDPANGNWTPLPNGGMPFYDAYTKSEFQARYGAAMHVFTDPSNDPGAYPDERAFLPNLVGTFTTTIQNAVREKHPNAQFEVLYAPDVNDAALTRAINLPGSCWTPSTLSCFKTENFTYTGDRDLDQARISIAVPAMLGFNGSQSSHLIGIGDYTTPWQREWSLSVGAGLESIVLFALDQFCLIGYELPLDPGKARSGFMGG